MARTPWSWSRMAILIGAPVLGATALVLAIMLLTAPDSPVPEVTRTAVLVGVLVGAAMGLLLVGRHFWRVEQATDAREHDMNERRSYEAYARAAEQLGSTAAPVRLAGLYALERMAQTDTKYRQTIINVMCSYLRMPYAPPEQAHDTVTDVAERGVRIAAQRILASHLDAGDLERFWPDVDLDLSGATLIDFSLAGARLRSGAFDRAHFAGDISFAGAQFAGDARFGNARFVSRRADFRGVWFAVKADFTGAGFAGDVEFSGAKFGAEALFGKTVFAGMADFAQAAFSAVGAFRAAMFVGRAEFPGAWFGADADFSSAAFSKDALFNGTRFTGQVEALGAYFAAHASFRGAYFTRNGDLRASRFGGNVDFTEAWFAATAMLDGGRVRVDTDRSLSIWPADWAIREPRDDVDARLPDREGAWGYLIRMNTQDKPIPAERSAPPNAP
ncbi:pentapeptide repeat-containing protein [Actinocrispum sp. NPDC049592]|uniref:pentapeptide repeat-containing protein n=1 Tax=Actinocrispum sp. NPDC049592 TaxID=3154835 RepID=UPI003418F762